MPPTRSLRSGPTLEAVRDALRAEFGAGARIVSAERVSTPGIGGLFRRTHVEAVVEVPDPLDPPTARVAIADGPVTRIGIAALLADAEAAEARIAAGDGTASTRADAFASVLDGFAADGIGAGVTTAGGTTVSAPRPSRHGTDPGRVDGAGARLQDVSAPVATAAADDTDRTGGTHPVAGPRAVDLLVAPVHAVAPALPVPAVRSADGDLVLLVGRPGDVDAAAGVFAGRYGLRPTDAADRRAGILARAEGVRNGHALLGVSAWDDAATIEGLAADQVWVVVDVGRKTEDSRAVVLAVAGRVSVAGVVAIGARETATPESVHQLGLPVVSLG
ncbi:hypothetical protein C1N91_07675 [Curtobacterium sp. SGAir0471]|uniref:hypothetical protein n=1 Tax=Curtobacterium sp. SGAir0471 TaxID=2070337 RepID=UPI0010CD4824|nr:hypothetical protein [Curtobacterium sp. SGAir0471]QCR43445.1 hypothetical protein C1N91_07675 [Curtobacterium sp. SGAir0471]